MRAVAYVMIKVLIVMSALLANHMAVYAQVRPSRTWLVDMARDQSASGVFPKFVGGVEANRSWGSAYQEQAWQFRLHGVIETYRFTDSADDVQWTTSLELHNELTANPFNDITFNPRTMRWEEFALVHMSAPTFSARGGWLHRCKHDIDNLDGPNETSIDAVSPVQRTVILSGPTIGFMLAPYKTSLGTFTVSAAAEWFLIAEDYRRPIANAVGSWSRMQGAVWMRAAYRVPVSAALAFHSNLWMSIPWFSSRMGAPESSFVTADARAEVCASIIGGSALMDVVLSAEHTFDELSYLNARPSTYLQLGLRLGSK